MIVTLSVPTASRQNQSEITTTYKLLGNNFEFFFEEDIDIIIDSFGSTEKDILKKINMLIELLNLDLQIQVNQLKRNKIIAKNIELLEYFLSHTDEYSIELNNLLKKDKS